MSSYQRGFGVTFDVIAERSFRMNGVNLWFRMFESGDKCSVALPVVFESYDSVKGIPPEPLITLSNEDAQKLLDELWRAGVRPTDQMDSMAAIGAVKYHLEDMRRLVFGKKEGDAE